MANHWPILTATPRTRPGGQIPPPSPRRASPGSCGRPANRPLDAPPGTRRRRPRLVLGSSRGRHRDRLGPPTDPRSLTPRTVRRGRAGGAAVHSTTPVQRWSRGPRADPDGGALAWEGEDGAVRELTNAELDGGRGPGCTSGGARRAADRPSAREKHDVVDPAERRDEFRTIGPRQHRPALSLEAAHRRVVVDGHDEAVCFGGRALQVAHVADVEQVEAAVRERDGAPGGAVARRRLEELADAVTHRPMRS